MVSRLILAITTCLVMLSLMTCGKGKEEEATHEQGQQTVLASKLPAALQDEIAAWRAVGGVTDIRDLAPKPPTPGSRNAADLHRSVGRLFANLSPSDDALFRKPWDASVKSLKYLVDFYGDTLPTIHEAVGLPYCNWGTRIEDTIDNKFSDLSTLQNESRLLIADALVRADEGDLDGTANCIVDLMRLGDQAASESHAIGAVVRFHFDDLATHAVAHIFKTREAVPAIIGETLAKREYRSTLRRALIHGGAVAVWAAFPAARGEGARPIEEQTIPQDLSDGLVWYLRTLRSLVEHSDQPYHKLASAFQMTPMPTSARIPDGLLIFESWDRLCKVAAAAENDNAMGRLALQLRDYKARTGQYPDPRNFQTPIDALTGQPISYAKSGDGFVLRATKSNLEGELSEMKWEW